MSGALTKGALVEYLPTFPPTPVVTVFQYNPESMVHTWTQAQPSGKPGVESSNPLAVPGLPGESFQFTIFLDADDDMVPRRDGPRAGGARVGSGNASRRSRDAAVPGAQPAGVRRRIGFAGRANRHRVGRFRLGRLAHMEPAEFNGANRFVLLELAIASSRCASPR